MSVINVISSEGMTLVQGVGGILLCQESWAMQSRTKSPSKEVVDKGATMTKSENNDTQGPRAEL